MGTEREERESTCVEVFEWGMGTEREERERDETTWDLVVFEACYPIYLKALARLDRPFRIKWIDFGRVGFQKIYLYKYLH